MPDIPRTFTGVKNSHLH